MPGANKPLRLDIMALTDRALTGRQMPPYVTPFSIDDGAMVFSGPIHELRGAGTLVLTIDWSSKNPPSGLIALSHPDWLLTCFVLMASIPGREGELRWRLLCPVTRHLVQVLYFDSMTQLFVSRPALGCRRPRSMIAYAKQCMESRVRT